MTGINTKPRPDRYSDGYQKRRANDSVNQRIDGDSQFAWTQLDYTGSDLTDIETRNHSGLQNIGEADDADTDTTKDKHVSNADQKDYRDTKTAYDAHAAAANAHGATGNIVGDGDIANETTYGVVKRAATVADAAAATNSTLTDSTGGTANTTVAAISGTGDDSTLNDNFADLTAQHNASKNDIDEIRTQLNAALAALQAAGLMT